ncbi:MULTISPECIES: sigma-70 family RNA polymerase sigma factor [Methylobacterium]|jgi:RNA polymerase sigma factor (sigma-70 family)|uniref:RNA polymerase sigma factor n=2 Tax=Methylobacterium TaxID=407 RepID=A0A0C6EXS9_9HYPH|nr:MULTISPECIES: sigma-70 family RNA polymerase sigma factor [Methylobacterium]MBK3399837.1 sigma-70 family RNA polymerase sigma factor [Methylobacterium ajmalii]MBK3407173.1 sigma-70 family RNA polymerase sigma factor [Methylobacterium ajmalii]MBK3424283.1 sigma-70 family RNA polymerase sigma factor [Methylobacterium ajmalii]MBZ6411781.1 sigma-70 family RNA polymerase sigma factor [Methylobacterium sp.]SFF20072.1 RNA polymerase sigma factor, sigma-70 family [Methylobacterium sp. yr596]
MTRDIAPNPSAPIPSGEDRPGLSATIRSHLGSQLRATYEALGDADPDNRFADLIARLEAVLKAQGEIVLPEFRDGLLQAVPSLRAFALSLTSNPARADDLVQDTLLKGWQHRARFQPGTNLNAWLFTILRNIFYSDHRKRVREVEDQDGSYAARLATAPHQGDRLDVEDLQSALAKLPPDQREALVLVGAEGVSYEEAAAIMGCKVGTVKSRVSRARGRLAELLGYDEEDLGTDRLIQSAMPKDA